MTKNQETWTGKIKSLIRRSFRPMEQQREKHKNISWDEMREMNRPDFTDTLRNAPCNGEHLMDWIFLLKERVKELEENNK